MRFTLSPEGFTDDVQCPFIFSYGHTDSIRIKISTDQRELNVHLKEWSLEELGSLCETLNILGPIQTAATTCTLYAPCCRIAYNASCSE